ncbi:AsmA family protein, partial [Salmonella sp. SAL04281]|uniref:AsmA family protein n=1 Tax=Salmonella sp. SAL04281 TaxID=3159859 RepID=UPI0039793A1F
YQLEDARLSGEASGEPLQGKTATFSAQGQLLLDQSAQIAEWNGLKLSVNQLRALGEHVEAPVVDVAAGALAEEASEGRRTPFLGE